LVRETKGNIDPSKLRFSNEWRKILCAKKHFKVLGVSYRQITDKTNQWWLDSQLSVKREELPLEDAEQGKNN